MADLRELVAVNVGRIRREKGWTQEDLAERAGLSARYVGQIADALLVEPAALVSELR
jgi:transcriptional regulator with XRE-family HTH domain